MNRRGPRESLAQAYEHDMTPQEAEKDPREPLNYLDLLDKNLPEQDRNIICGTQHTDNAGCSLFDTF
uniref:Uncharacterized protein n=1 Tax=Acrobeloides nanus TaxID=290746 RepID=A0A914CHJ1_9BILA